MLGFVVQRIAELIAKDPSSNKWAYVTALFGWCAFLAICGWFLAVLLRLPSYAQYLMAAAVFLVGIVLSREWKRLEKK